MRLTEEQIAKACEDLDGMANRKAINRLYQKQDESHLWPISGKFNATTRAINRIRKAEQQGANFTEGLEYCYAIDHEISEIVNNENNW